MSQDAVNQWLDLTRMWQAEGARISVDELERYMQRERRLMHTLAAVELAGLGLGIAVGVWLGAAQVWMSRVFVVFCLVMAWVAWRRRAEPELLGGADLLTSLRASMLHEDWMAGQLRFGRALSFMVMFVILMQASHVLRHFAVSGGVGSLWALLACGAWVTAIIAWNLVLLRRSQRRRLRLESFLMRLKANP